MRIKTHVVESASTFSHQLTTKKRDEDPLAEPVGVGNGAVCVEPRSDAMLNTWLTKKRDEGPLAKPVGAGNGAVCVEPRSDAMLNTWLYPQRPLALSLSRPRVWTVYNASAYDVIL